MMNGKASDKQQATTTTTTTTTRPLLHCTARRLGPRCPFGNDVVEFTLRPGSCVCLTGASGRGKSTLAMSVVARGVAVSPQQQQQQQQHDHMLQSKLDCQVTCEWDDSLTASERCGILLQQTTLVDELTVASNLALALQKHNQDNEHSTTNKNKGRKSQQEQIDDLLSTVGLDAQRDGAKRPHTLSGGQARRASLALQLAQRKHVIVLDEPFTGLDAESANSVATALVQLRVQQKTALLLISHQPHLVQRVMDPQTTTDNVTIHLTQPPPLDVDTKAIQSTTRTMPCWRIHGVSWRDRFADRTFDYVVYSLPLIALAFMAAGMALSMLTADVLQRLDVTDPVVRLVDTEVRPLIQMLTGEPPSAWTMLGVRLKVKNMLQQTVPVAKATLYAIGMTRLLVLELCPLLTALLLCGRIGGSYAGRVATLGATKQDFLLTSLGVSPVAWTLGPSLAAASLAAPGLTVAGTTVALACAAWMGKHYELLAVSEFYSKAMETAFPRLRLRGVERLANVVATIWTTTTAAASCTADDGENGDQAVCTAEPKQVSYEWKDLLDFRPTFSDSYTDAVVECLTHPAIFHIVKAIVLGVGIVLVSDQCARFLPLTPRLVPLVITAAVVLDGLYVLLADWGFSQLWLRRHPSDTEWNFQG